MIFLNDDPNDAHPLTESEKKSLSDCNNDSFWGKVEMILTISDSFQLAANMIQRERATLLDVANALKGLKERINSWNIESVFGVARRTADKFTADAKEIIQRRENQYIRAQDHHVLRAAQILCDHPYRDWGQGEYREALKWLREWGADVMKLYPSQFSSKAMTMTRDQLIDHLGEQIIDFQSEANEFIEKLQEIDRLRAPTLVNSFEYDMSKPENQQIKVVNWV